MLSSFPGSPMRIGTPRFFTIITFPRSQRMSCFLEATWRRILVVVSPIRHILVEPAPEADCRVAVKGMLLSRASWWSMQFSSEPSSAVLTTLVPNKTVSIVGDLAFRTCELDRSSNLLIFDVKLSSQDLPKQLDGLFDTILLKWFCPCTS